MAMPATCDLTIVHHMMIRCDPTMIYGGQDTRRGATIDSKKLVSVLTLGIILLFILSGVADTANARIGSFTFSYDKYSVTGDLTNAIITHEGAIQLQMSIDQTISTSIAPVHIIANGVWVGKTDFVVLNGSIENVKGTVRACLLTLCQGGNFTGTGSWTGTLVWSRSFGSQGVGTFKGNLNVTGSTPSLTGQVPVSGNWSAVLPI